MVGKVGTINWNLKVTERGKLKTSQKKNNRKPILNYYWKKAGV
jgi:hypothetical protein